MNVLPVLSSSPDLIAHIDLIGRMMDAHDEACQAGMADAAATWMEAIRLVSDWAAARAPRWNAIHGLESAARANGWPDPSPLSAPMRALLDSSEVTT